MTTSYLYSWEYKCRYGFIPIADERVGVQVSLWDLLRTRAIPERFCGGVSRIGTILSVRTFSFTLPLCRCVSDGVDARQSV